MANRWRRNQLENLRAQQEKPGPRIAQAQSTTEREPSPGSSPDAGDSTPLNPALLLRYDPLHNVFFFVVFHAGGGGSSRPTELWTWRYR